MSLDGSLVSFRGIMKGSNCTAAHFAMPKTKGTVALEVGGFERSDRTGSSPELTRATVASHNIRTAAATTNKRPREVGPWLAEDALDEDAQDDSERAPVDVLRDLLGGVENATRLTERALRCLGKQEMSCMGIFGREGEKRPHPTLTRVDSHDIESLEETLKKRKSPFPKGSLAVSGKRTSPKTEKKRETPRAVSRSRLISKTPSRVM